MALCPTRSKEPSKLAGAAAEIALIEAEPVGRKMTPSGSEVGSWQRDFIAIDGGLRLLGSVAMGSQEMKRHIGNTANHPTVMRNCCDLKCCTRQKVKEDAILVLDRAMAGKHCADMRSMAVWCSNNRGIVDRPSPSRLVRRTPERELAETDDLEATIRKPTHFIGRLKGLEKCFNHLELLGMQTATSQR